MGKDPAMPFYVNDWLSSSRVACMTLEQQAAYMRLLCHCWASQDASLPSDDEQLAGLSGMGQGWLQNGKGVVMRCFEAHPSKQGFLTNKRLFELWEERLVWREKSSEGGKKSAAKRWGKKTSKPNKGGVTTVVTKDVTNGQPNGNSSSSSSSLEEEDKSSSSKREPSADDFEIARMMVSKIAAMMPDAMGLRPAQQPITAHRWATDIRLMRERDGRAPPEIRKVFEWAHRDDFWSDKILSAGNLREKFDTLQTPYGL